MRAGERGCRRTLLAVAVGALLLAWMGWAQLPGHSLLSLGAPVTGDAEWIWLPAARDRRAAVSFYAVRDVQIDEMPEAPRWMVLADEEYQAFVNGRRIGSGVYREGARLDTYDVSELLRPGTNRLIVEVRSGRGTGGLIACLHDAASGRVLSTTDRRWRILTHHSDALFRDWAPIPGGRSADSWGRPPVGRWGRLEIGPVRQPARKVVRRRPARRALALGRALPWQELRRNPPDLPPLTGIPRPARTGGRGVLLDFGEEVSGHLSLRFADAEERHVALVFLSAEPIDPLSDAPRYPQQVVGRPDVEPIVLAGRPGWSDAAARRFRYAAVVATSEITEAWVDPPASWETVLPPRQATHLNGLNGGGAIRGASAQGRHGGLFGLEPPPLRSPVEHEVRRQLEGVAGG